MSNDIAITAMWDSAVTDTDAVTRNSILVRAKVALAGSWPFLAAAQDEEEFSHRLALISEQIERRVPEQVREEVVASLKRDFDTVRTARLERTASLQKQARTIAKVDGDDSLPQAYVHVHKHAGDSAEDSTYQVDHIGSPTFLQTVGHFGDHDEAMQRAREFGLPNGLPIYENGRYVEGKRLAPVEAGLEFFDAESGQWVKAATNYQPDPDKAWRYHYPDPPKDTAFGGQPTAPSPNGVGVAGGVGPTSVDTDGFPVDYAQGEYDRAAAKIQEQITPGTWSVTPGSEWPVRPNAGHQGQEQVFASRQASYYDRMKPEMQDPANGNEMYDRGYDHGWRGLRAATGHPDYMAGHAHGKSDREAEDVMGYPRSRAMASRTPAWVRDWSQSHGAIAAQAHERGEHRVTASLVCPTCNPQPKVAYRVQAQEGIVPTPGPNPNYFSQGTQGLQGNQGFPENPSSAIEPKTDNHLDDLYGEVPPQVSPGSAQGQVDGGGYSRQGVTADYKYVKQQGDKWVVTQKGTGKVLSHHDSQEEAEASFRAMMQSKHGSRLGFSRSAGERTAGYSRTGARHVAYSKSQADYEEGYDHGYAGLPHQDLMPSQAYLDGHADGSVAGGHEPEEPARWPHRQAGKLEDTPTRDELARWEDPNYEGGPDPHGPGQHLTPDQRTKALQKMFDEQQAYRNRSRQANMDRPVVPCEDRNCRADSHWATDGKRYGETYDHPHQPTVPLGSLRNAYASRTASTDGRIVGLCDNCNAPVRYHTEGGGHLRHLHNNSPKCKDGKTASFSAPQFFNVTAAADFFRAYDNPGGTCSFCGKSASHDLVQISGGQQHKIGDACQQHAKEYDEKRVMGSRQAAVLENPTAENPTGRGADPYRAKTSWEGFEHQRPRQELEGEGGMNANTPTTAPDPIKTGPNINTPGGDLDSDGPHERDDDEEDDND